MHIVFLTNIFPAPGEVIVGSGNYVANMARIMKENGHKVTVITESATRRVYRWNGITIRKVSLAVDNIGKDKYMRNAYKYIYRSVCYRREIEKVNKIEKVDIVQSVSAYGLALIRTRRIPYIVRVSEYPPLWRGANEESFNFITCVKSRRMDEELSFLALKRADKVIIPSQLLCNLIRKKIRILPEVIESPVLVEKQSYCLLEPNLQTGHYWITYGSQMLRKEVHVLAKIIDRLLDEYPTMKYVMIGRNGEIKYHGKSISVLKLYNKLIKKHRDRFFFLGQISDRERLFSLIKNAYACILPTRVDNLPNTCLEAMALGKIVISTTSIYGTSVEQLITDQYNGFLARVDDEADLFHKIEQAMQLSDEEKRDMEERAYNRVCKLMPENVYDTMLSLYNKTIKDFNDKRKK